MFNDFTFTVMLMLLFSSLFNWLRINFYFMGFCSKFVLTFNIHDHYIKFSLICCSILKQMTELSHSVISPMSFRLEYKRGSTGPTMFQRYVRIQVDINPICKQGDVADLLFAITFTLLSGELFSCMLSEYFQTNAHSVFKATFVDLEEYASIFKHKFVQNVIQRQCIVKKLKSPWLYSNHSKRRLNLHRNQCAPPQTQRQRQRRVFHVDLPIQVIDLVIVNAKMIQKVRLKLILIAIPPLQSHDAHRRHQISLRIVMTAPHPVHHRLSPLAQDN